MEKSNPIESNESNMWLLPQNDGLNEGPILRLERMGKVKNYNSKLRVNEPVGDIVSTFDKRMTPITSIKLKSHSSCWNDNNFHYS